MPASAATFRAPSSSASQIFSCHVLATMPSVTPLASRSGRSGTPAPLLNSRPRRGYSLWPDLSQLRRGQLCCSQRSPELARHRFVVIVEADQVVPHPVALGHQIANVLG